MISIEKISPTSPHLDTVKRLWRENSQTLGYFTEGAFLERAANGQILGAIQDSVLAGYVLFYANRREHSVRITHLCVSAGHRGQGIAHELIVGLSKSKKSYRGLGLHCRRDFEIWGMWPKLGFSAVREKMGRGRDQAPLTFFWLDHKHRDLFSGLTEFDESHLNIVLDANVFYDLLDPQRNEALESMGLTADWLEPLVRLFVAPELCNEIHNNADAEQREKRTVALQDFDLLKTDHQDFLAAHSQVISVCGQGSSEQCKADRRQLAWAIASDADVFVTRDQELLGYSDTVFHQIGISIERPADVISKFDELCNEKNYRRDRLFGTDITYVRCRSSDVESVAEAFVTAGEKKADLVRVLNHSLAHPMEFESRLASVDQRLLCVHVAECRPHVVNIPVLRLSHKEKETRLGKTLLRTVLANAVQKFASDGTICIRVTDTGLSPPVQEALRDQGFLQATSGWFKICVRGVVPVTEIDSHLRHLAMSEGIGDVLPLSGQSDPDIDSILELERLIWPGKISGANVPCFIVPIAPRFAEDLFDGRLTQNRLWKARTDLVLNPDSVYYRAVKPGGVLGQGRILWYVSEDDGIPGSKMLRACSQLTRVEIGDPQDLYRKYRRFGVYEWPHVRDTAKEGKVMAIEFTNTELLRTPVTFVEAHQLIHSKIGKKYWFQSPVRIDEDLFLSLYQLGTGDKA